MMDGMEKRIIDDDNITEFMVNWRLVYRRFTDKSGQCFRDAIS